MHHGRAAYANTTAAIRPFTIYQIVDTETELELLDSVVAYATVDSEYLLKLLAIDADHNLRHQVDRIGLDIGWWSRLHAQAERVEEYLARRYAVWKSLRRRATEGEPLEHTGKRPTKDQLADLYRVHENYGKINSLLEASRESTRCVAGVVQALRTKAKKMDTDIYRTGDGELHRRTL